jgi:hypothetical protein
MKKPDDLKAVFGTAARAFTLILAAAALLAFTGCESPEERERNRLIKEAERALIAALERGESPAEAAKAAAPAKKSGGEALAKQIKALEDEKGYLTDKIIKEEVEKYGMNEYAGEEAGKRIYMEKSKIDERLKPLYEAADNLDDEEYRKYAEAMGLITEPEYLVKLSDDGKGAVITAYNGLGGEVMFPAELEGFPVTRIEVNKKWGTHSNRITSVVYPDTVTYITYFTGLKNLKKATLPKNWKWVNDRLFEGCSALESFTIPGTFTGIGERAFAESGLKSITIPNSVTRIDKAAFKDCRSLASVTIPDGVTGFGTSAFSGCTSLASVTIPDSVTMIYDSAFEGCTNLVTVTISPVKRDWKNSNVFSGCPKVSLASQAALKAAGYTGGF